MSAPEVTAMVPAGPLAAPSTPSAPETDASLPAATEIEPPALAAPPAVRPAPMDAVFSATIWMEPSRTTIAPPSSRPAALTVDSNSALRAATAVAAWTEPNTATSWAVIDTPRSALTCPEMDTDPSADRGTAPLISRAVAASVPLGPISASFTSRVGVTTVSVPVLIVPAAPTTRPKLSEKTMSPSSLPSL